MQLPAKFICITFLRCELSELILLDSEVQIKTVSWYVEVSDSTNPIFSAGEGTGASRKIRRTPVPAVQHSEHFQELAGPCQCSTTT